MKGLFPHGVGALAAHEYVVPALHLECVDVPALAGVGRLEVFIGRLPGFWFAQGKTGGLAIGTRRTGAALVRRRLVALAKNAITAHTRNRDQIFMLRSGVQVSLDAMLAVEHLHTQLSVPGQALVAEYSIQMRRRHFGLSRCDPPREQWNYPRRVASRFLRQGQQH